MFSNAIGSFGTSKRMNNGLEPFIQRGDAEQKMKHAFIDVKRCVQERARAQFDEPPKPKRALPASRAPVGLIEKTHGESEGRRRSGMSVRHGGGPRGLEARVDGEAGAKQERVNFEGAQIEDRLNLRDGVGVASSLAVLIRNTAGE